MAPVSSIIELPRVTIRPSKLAPPRQRAESVLRKRLLRHLAAAAETPIVLICASGGYGKSTLAAQWAVQCARPAAWINLDDADNDPIAFLNHVAHALDRVGSVDSNLLEELSSMSPRVEEVVLPALAAEFARLSPLELIFDDVRQLTESTSLRLIDILLQEVPPGSQVVLATRVDPAIPLARRRAMGELLELRADRLAFDADETRSLATTTGKPLSDESVELLLERTEGWPAGIALALHSVHGYELPDEIARMITGRQRDIADYLVEVILARATEAQRRFLLATSVLRGMTASLCDAVLAATDSADVLRELERSNSFVIALDDHHGWYRYHHLFGELLRAELDRSEPELASTYLAKAAEWYERGGSDPGETFRCARECGDFERAGRVALGYIDLMVSRGQIETVRLWLQQCSDEEIASDSQLSIAAGWTYLLLGERDKAQRYTAAAERGELDVPSADGASSVRSSLANLRGSLAPHGIGQMLADSEFAYSVEKNTGSDSTTIAILDACRGIGTAHVLLGHAEEAIRSLQEAEVITRGRPEVANQRVVCLGFLAFAAADLERWSDARKWTQEARALSAEHRLDATLLSAVAFTARAMVLAHDRDFHEAGLELDELEARDASLFHAVPWLDTYMHLRMGESRLAIGDRVAARQHAELARAELSGYPDPGVLAPQLSELDERINTYSDLHLTAAEFRVISFLPTNLSIKEIAARLYLSRATVKTHVSSIYAKLGVATRSEAVEKLGELGLAERM